MTTTIIDNINNNNNYDSNNERLFWKVFNNIYIFKTIINSVNSGGYKEYDDPSQIHFNNRRKFKDITSLKWMIVYNQYQLLKCKLQANEYIEIHETQIQDMIRDYVENQKEEVLESLQLLFRYKSKELCDYGLMEYIIKTKTVNLQLVKLISTYQIVYPSELEALIQQSKSVEIIDTIINPQNIQTIISTSTKNKSLSLAFNNIGCKEEMVQFILNNQQLYSIPSSYSSSSTLEFKRFKSIDGTSKTLGSRNTITGDDDDDIVVEEEEYGEIIKIPLIDIFSLRSIENQDKLIKLGYYMVPENIIDQIKQMDIINQKKQVHELILTNNFQPFSYYQFINRYGETTNTLNELVPLDSSVLELIKSTQFSDNKEYHTFFSSKFMDVFKSKSEISKQLSFKLIKYYLSNPIFSGGDGIDSEIITYISRLENKQDFEEALKLISNTRLENKLPSTWNDFLFKITKTGVTDPFNEDKRVIKDKETIDWLSTIDNDWINKFILSGVELKDEMVSAGMEPEKINTMMSKIKESNHFKLKYETSELVDYAHEKLTLGSPLSFKFGSESDISSGYSYSFANALSNCNIKELSNISSKLSKLNIKNVEFTSLIIPINKEMTTNQINELIQYLNSNDYINIGKLLFRELMFSISEHKSSNPNFNLKEITEIKFTKYPILAYHKKLYSSNNTMMDGARAYTLSPNIMELMLNTKDEFNLILNHPTYFNHYIDNQESYPGFVLYQIYEQQPKKFTSNWKSEDIVSCIESLVNKFNTFNINDQPGQIQAIEVMINHFFKELIQVDKLSIKTLKYIYGLIKNNEKPINFTGQSLFHSFHYLCIKSPKLEIYLLGHPYLSNILNTGPLLPQRIKYMEIIDYQYQGYNIRKYLDPKVFNFEFIFGKCNNEKEDGIAEEKEENSGASFDEILKQLVYHISHLPCLSDNQMVNFENDDSPNNEDYFRNQIFNSNMEYYLKIKREDLFFEELEYIHQFEDTFNQYQQKQLSQNNPVTPPTIQFKLNGFEFQSPLIQFTDKVLKEESFQKFISFNSYATIIKSLKWVMVEMVEMEEENCDIFKRFNSIINKILIDNGIDGFWSLSDSSDILRSQQLFPEINNFKIISNLNIIKSFNSSKDPCYNLQFHQLLFKLFPSNVVQQLITINELDVDKAIGKKKINFLKFYIENNLIKNNVSQYLKLKLSNHYDFKHLDINWPK